MSTLDYPSILLLLFLMSRPPWLGHRYVIASGAFIIACSFLVLAFYDDMAIVAVIFMKLAAFPTFAPVHILKAESFPTVLRMTACGLCSLFGRMGSIMAPTVYEYYATEGGGAPMDAHGGIPTGPHKGDGHTHHGHPGGNAGTHAHKVHDAVHEGDGIDVGISESFLTVASTIAFCAALTVLLSRETKGKPLPDFGKFSNELYVFGSDGQPQKMAGADEEDPESRKPLLQDGSRKPVPPPPKPSTT